MSEQHTPEPWISNFRSIKQDFQMIGLGPESGRTIACVMGGDTSGPYFVQSNAEADANARRIVAAVNACAGFSIEELEGASLFNDSISAQDEIDSLKSEVEEMKLIIATDTGTESAVAAMQKQRDELLAALESILPEFRQHSLRNLRDDETSENHRCRVFDHDDHLYEIANKVIARVKANA